MRRRSINMRPVNYVRARQGNDSDSDDAPLVSPVGCKSAT